MTACLVIVEGQLVPLEFNLFHYLLQRSLIHFFPSFFSEPQASLGGICGTRFGTFEPEK